VNDWSQDLAAFDALAGEEDWDLSDEDRAGLFRASMEGGFNADATVAAFDAFVGRDDSEDFGGDSD
jgi:hypothetical protein